MPDPRLQSDAAVMKEFLTTQYHDVLIRYLELMEKDSMERLVTVAKDEHDYHRGVVMGLRDAKNLPATIQVWAERNQGT